MSLKVHDKPLYELTAAEWKVILEHGSFRGYKINRLAKAMNAKNVDALSYNIGKGEVSYKKSSKKTYTIDLNRVKKCPSTWTFARLTYWLKTIFGCDQSKHQAEIDHLAQCIYNKLHAKPYVGKSKASLSHSVTDQESSVPDEPKDLVPSVSYHSKDMILMKNALTLVGKAFNGDDINDPEIFVVGTGGASEIYALWFHSDKNIITIQKGSAFADLTSMEKVSFQIDPKGQIISVYVDGQPMEGVKDLPAERLSLFPEALKKAIELVSSYGLSENKKFIEIKTIRRGISKAPLVHLNKLGDVIHIARQKKNHPRMDVHLLKNDLSSAKGSDNGGLARDYLNLVIESTIKNSGLPFKSVHPKGLFLPTSDQISKDLFFSLPGEEITVYQNLGKVMMYCYRSKLNNEDFKNNQYMIGQHFHEALFTGAFALDWEEIKTPFLELPLQTKIKMCCSLLLELENEKWAKIAESFLTWTKGDSIPKLEGSFLELAGDYINDDWSDVDSTKVNEDPEKFVETVNAALLNYKFGKGENGSGVALGSLLAPIHAIAQGLVAQENQFAWLNKKPSIEFCNKVQGSLDRNSVANAFECVSANMAASKELNKKINWLKEWICSNQTSDAHVRAFLVYMTGTNALHNEQKLYYGEQTESNLVPTAITCKHLLLISSIPITFEGDTDTTKEGFIKIIHKYILNDVSNEFTID